MIKIEINFIAPLKLHLGRKPQIRLQIFRGGKIAGRGKTATGRDLPDKISLFSYPVKEEMAEQRVFILKRA